MERALTTDPKDLLHILWRQRWQIALTFALVVLGTLVATYLTKPVYSATGKILMESRQRGVSALYSELFWMLKAEEAVEVQIELIKSRPMLERALGKADYLRRAPGGRGMTPEEFRDTLKVKPASEGSNIFLITVQSIDPQLAALLANRLAETYVEDNTQHNRAEVTDSLTFIENQLIKVKGDLTRAEDTLQNYKLSQGMPSLPDQSRAIVDQSAQVEASLTQKRIALLDLNTRIATLRSRLGLSPTAALATVAVTSDPQVQSLRNQLLDAENKQALNKDMTRDHPDFLQNQARIKTLRRLLAEEVARTVRARIGFEMPVRLDADATSVSMMQDLIRTDIDRITLESNIRATEQLNGRLKAKMLTLPAKEIHVARLLRSAEVSDNTYKLLLRKREEMKLLQPVTTGNTRIIEPAIVPTRPDFPNKATNLSLGIVVGLGLGLGLALFLELLDDTIRTTEEARAYLKDLPLLGMLPWVKEEAKDPRTPLLFILSHPRSAAAEAIRTIRTNIRFLSTDRPITAITITSAVPGEGKSRTMANLAVSLAQTNRSVVLIDADLRNPVQHTILRMSNAIGLTNVLVGDSTLKEVLQPTLVSGLQLLASGPLPPNPLELLESNRMKEVLTHLRQQFDFVLCDAPAIGAVTDASVLAVHMDGLIFLAAVERVSSKGLKGALELLTAAKTRILGTIIRQRKADQTRAYGYYYYHSDESQEAV